MWNRLVCPKYRCILLLVMRDRLQTTEWLCKYGVSSHSLCLILGLESETLLDMDVLRCTITGIIHELLRCSYSRTQKHIVDAALSAMVIPSGGSKMMHFGI